MSSDLFLASVAVGSRLMPAEGQSVIVAGALISLALNSILIRAGQAIQPRLAPAYSEKDVKLSVGDH